MNPASFTISAQALMVLFKLFQSIWDGQRKFLRRTGRGLGRDRSSLKHPTGSYLISKKNLKNRLKGVNNGLLGKDILQF